jgi:hypothetical protein
MPLPTPSSGESTEEFIARCMGDAKAIEEFPDESQRYAVCQAQVNASVKAQESYNDYPQAASDNAARAIRLRDEYPKQCGTQVGWVRASQLANRENISRDTIARMAAFERHRQNSQGDPKEDCGARMWLAWGGDEGIAWAQRKLEQIDQVENLKTIKDHILSMIDELPDRETNRD